MVRHYDMASCEMILDPQIDSIGSPVEDAPQNTATALRLLTVEEAVASEQRAEQQMPADLMLKDAAAFVSEQN